MRDLDPAPDTPPPGPVAEVPSLWQRIRRLLGIGQDERLSAARLNDHALRDIGLTRSAAREQFGRRRDPRF